jgi:hypothetical protein
MAEAATELGRTRQHLARLSFGAAAMWRPVTIA